MDRVFFWVVIRVREPFGSGSSEPQFSPGELVHHERYGYRGVVVDFDDTCQADEAWYQANQTQPSRAQPWYHVLVDGSDQVTYVAETNLERDLTGGPVNHALVGYFFEGFENGGYIRNQRPWPSAR